MRWAALITRFVDPHAEFCFVCTDDETLNVSQRIFDGLYELRRRALLLEP